MKEFSFGVFLFKYKINVGLFKSNLRRGVQHPKLETKSLRNTLGTDKNETNKNTFR